MRRRQGSRVHRRVPCRLHLRGGAVAVHPPGRVRRLRACEPVCPVEAIYYEDDLPDEWHDYYTANVAFFDDIGSPGGAAKIGVFAKDHPLIAALPPQVSEHA